MAIETPLWMTNGTYSARRDRRFIERALGGQERVFEGLVVSQRAAGANMTFDVSAGSCAIKGDDQANQGIYFFDSTAVENRAAGTSPGAGSRLDYVCAVINDAEAGSARTPANAGDIIIVAGPGGATTPPTVPATAIVLASILRTSAEASIVNANITDLRQVGAYGGGQTVSTSDPSGRGVANDIWLKVI